MRCSAANAAYRLVRGRPPSGEAQFAASAISSRPGYLVVRCQLDPAVLARIRGRPEELVRQTVAAWAAAGES